jgi:TolB-like protein/cytochrome c-type biogenesis protein CcmH/NrfG
VLPFADMSPSHDQAYFCEGIAEEILIALNRVSGLRVTPRTSSFRYRQSGADAREIGERLCVATLLDGSVRKSGDSLRIAVQLIDTADGVHIWSERYDRDLRDVFLVQEEIARSVVSALQLTLSAHEHRALAKAAAAKVDAYDYYLRGRQYYYQYNRRGVHFALDLFRHAIEVDPRFARALAGVSDCHAFLFLNEGRKPVELEHALEASRQALLLDSELAEAHASLGAALSLSGQPAAEAFEEAIRLDPAQFEAHYFYARDCFARGELERGAREFEAAMRARPEDYQSPLLVAQIYDDLGRGEDAVEVRRSGVRIAEEHLRMYPDDARALYMGANGLVSLGDKEQGLAWAERALALDPADPMVLYNIACIRALAGAVPEALDCLERAVDGGLDQRGWVEHDSNLDAVRSHPRFAGILARLA